MTTIAERGRYGMRRHLYYQGKAAAYLACGGTDDTKTVYVLVSKDLVVDILNQHPKYDAETLTKALAENRMKIILNPDRFTQSTVKDKMLQAIQIVPTKAVNPIGYFLAKIVPSVYGG